MAKDTIKKLTDSQHIRLRTEMYLGSRSPHTQTVVNWNGEKLVAQETTWVPAIYTAFREILDNSLDELLGHGHGNRIDITYDPETMTFSVRDNGRGIPTDWDEGEKMHKATMVLISPRAGRNFDEREVVRGTNGIGASATVHTSERASVTVWRNGEKFQQHFEEPTAVLPELQVNKAKITKVSGDKTGTLIEFVPSKEVFKHRILPMEFVRSRITEIAANHPEVKFYFNDEKISVKATLDKTFFDSLDYVKVAVDVDKFLSTFYLVPQFASEGEYVHSTVNDIPAFNGGNHIDVFKRVFFSSLLKALERESKRRGLSPNRSDISEGILVYNSTTMHAPNFDSQSKTRLINEEVETHVKTALDDEKLYKRIIRDHKSWIEQIYARCAARTQKKDDAETNKLARKVLRNKVPKLMDATGKDRTKCILMLTEGDCIHEDTHVVVLDYGVLVHKPIKETKVGDLVLTHKGNFKPICNKSAKIIDGMIIKTASGNHITVSRNHKIPVFNKTTSQVELLKAEDLDLNQHRMFKTTLDLGCQFLEIYDIDQFNHAQFSLCVTYGNDHIKSSIITSPDHLFQVFDITTASIIKVKANCLDLENHLLLAANI
jgi:DNA gyrase/topoisomerase IV subunit B